MRSSDRSQHDVPASQPTSITSSQASAPHLAIRNEVSRKGHRHCKQHQTDKQRPQCVAGGNVELLRQIGGDVSEEGIEGCSIGCLDEELQQHARPVVPEQHGQWDVVLDSGGEVFHLQ